jgi:hypothetical protein
VELKPVNHWVPLKTIQERLGHTLGGSLTFDVCTHAEMPRNIEAGRRAGKAIERAVNSVSLIAAQEKGFAGGVQRALANQQQIGCGGPQRPENATP